jgi:hypothetical protein
VSSSAERWRWTRRGARAFPAGEHSLAQIVRWAARQSGRSVTFDAPITKLGIENEIITFRSVDVDSLESHLAELDRLTDFELIVTGNEIRVASPQP